MKQYHSIEVGPIRPPSEAESLMIRVTRNCPWNKCTFCTLYKGTSFSVRSLEAIFSDIDSMKACIDIFEQYEENEQHHELNKLGLSEMTLINARRWYKYGMHSIFLQDANSMVMKTEDLLAVLNKIKETFGTIERITSYGRSHTIARINDADLIALRKAGLNRIHIGMETGSDTVLNLINKGVDQETHIKAGQKIMAAGIELSEYYMPGLGGIEYSKIHALETAKALNAINPNYIRLRTLAVTTQSELFQRYKDNTFTRTNDDQIVEEIKIFIENLTVDSYIMSDHILNLLPEIQGKLPEDKEQFINILDWYLGLDDYNKMLFKVGRRTGIFRGIKDINQEGRRVRVKKVIADYRIHTHNLDAHLDEMMNRFI